MPNSFRDDSIYISKTLYKHLAKTDRKKSEGDKENPKRDESVYSEQSKPYNNNNIAQTTVPSERLYSDFIGNLQKNQKMSTGTNNESTTTTPEAFPTLDPNYLMRHAAFDPTILLYGIRGEYERKFQQYQSLWRQKWDELNRINVELHKTNSANLAKEVDRIEKLYFNRKNIQSPCKELESELFNCYQNNGDKPLFCNNLVKKFSSCVEEERLKILKQK